VTAIVAAFVVVALVGIGLRWLRHDTLPAATPLAVGTNETVPCPSDFAKGAAFAAATTEVEGQTYSCGAVVVPENHDKPDGRTIELFYLKLNSTAQPAATDPMVYLAGGPGSSGTTELTTNPTLLQSLGQVRKTRDVIAYDQRGTGYSNYLLCAPFEATLGILQDRDKNPQIAQVLEDLKTQDQGVGVEGLRQSLCGASTQLLAGVDLAQYNSVSSARDIPELVKALGYAGGFSLYGTSYGTKLAQVAMRTVPENLTGVILDGVGGPSIPNIMWSSTKPAAPYAEIVAQCKADAACDAAYPNLGKRFSALLTKLQKMPLVLDPPLTVWAPLRAVFPAQISRIDPQFFIDLARLNNLAMGGAFAGSVPRMIKAAEEGDVAWFRASKLNDAKAAATPPPVVAEGATAKPLVPSDQPLFEKPLTELLDVATQLSESVGGQGPDALWVTVALGDLAVRLKKGEKQADLVEALLRLAVLPNSGTTAQQLLDYSKAYLSPESAKAADGIVAKMTRNDVRSTMWNIQDVAMTLGTPADSRGYAYGMQFAMNCADELAFASLEQGEQDLARTPYPQLAAYPLALNEQWLLGCTAYPKPLDKSAVEPVTSDIPALVYIEALDNETPAQWGRDATQGLSRKTVVEWANNGHVIAAHDPKLCAGDMAAAFLSNPGGTVDTSCTQAPDYQMAWVLR
jgi:pimeloyl-ACP methyl ester carboxylesterase